ncbi:hypothetical protein J3F84DRAFT_3605 [Trichoderma pleuroticola]
MVSPSPLLSDQAKAKQSKDEKMNEKSSKARRMRAIQARITQLRKGGETRVLPMLSKARIHPLSRTHGFGLWSRWTKTYGGLLLERAAGPVEMATGRLVTDPDRARWPETGVSEHRAIANIPAKCKGKPQLITDHLHTSWHGVQGSEAASTEYVYRYPDAHQTSAHSTRSLSYLYMPRTLLYIFPRCDTSQFISPTAGKATYPISSTKTSPNTHLPLVASALSQAPH